MDFALELRQERKQRQRPEQAMAMMFDLECQRIPIPDIIRHLERRVKKLKMKPVFCPEFDLVGSLRALADKIERRHWRDQ